MKYIDIILVALLGPVAAGMAGLSAPLALAASSQGNNLPEIVNFTCSPSVINAGGLATLSWHTTNALSVSVDHGIGDVSTEGQTNVAPVSSTIYKITASNKAGSRSGYATLYVKVADANTGDIISSDPVTGRNAQIDFAWKDYYFSKSIRYK